MALPVHFASAEDYLETSVQFFKEYQHLYNFPNTDILVENILDKIDIDENIDLNSDISTQNEFLNTFFKKLQKLQVENDVIEESDCDLDEPLSPKKRHEIIHLAKEIKAMCEDINCNVVVDFGSGLGYLDQLIFKTTNYKVLGIECNDSHYVGAKKRQRKYHHNSIDNVKYIKHRVTEDSSENIKSYLEDKFLDYGQFCITGLHACADLSVDAINLFLKMAEAKAIVIMPCCYHKMSGKDGYFQNFPISACLKGIFERNNSFEYIKVPFLRLAAQPPCLESKLEDLVFNLLSRAVLQLYACRYNCKLKRNKRKAVKTKTLDNNFDAYLQDAITNGFSLIKSDLSTAADKVKVKEEITSIWNQISPLTFKKAGIFIILQNYLQPVIENFVLYDRIIYMKENGVTNCRFKKILNEKTSPRCLALLANKNSSNISSNIKRKN